MIGKEIQMLVYLGFLKDMSPYSSPILIDRKNSSLKEIITDFRFLSS